MELDTLPVTQHRLKVKISRRDKSNETFAKDVLNGLSSNPKSIPPKYFYDKIGSRLFEQICELPEYYPTRTEHKIIREYAGEIARFAQEDRVLIELGSGSSTKTRLIIEAFLDQNDGLHYIPIDISKSMLLESAKILLRKYPELEITALVSDYLTALNSLKKKKAMGSKLILFLGSSIGNFDRTEGLRFLCKVRETIHGQDRLLLGIDLLKDRKILEPAYDDAQGVTPDFNLNLLTRINRELDADFDLSKFRHKAFFNEKMGRMEMHLESTANQSVTIGQLSRTFIFERSETIHTENSYKYSLEQIRELAELSDFCVRHSWTDDKNWFSLNLLEPI